MEAKNLNGLVAIVAGASRSIGKGIALELAEAGALVYVVARSVKPGDHRLPGTVGQTVADIEAAGGHAIAVACDLTDDKQIEALFERVNAEQGRLDILVNCAFCDPGLIAMPPIWETPDSWYDDINDIGTRAYYQATRLATSRMVPAGSGLIINVTSWAAENYYLNVAYGMGKAAVDKMTKDVAQELKGTGVSILSIWPYMVRTEAIEALLDSGIEIPDMEGVDSDGDGIPGLEHAESQRFAGRCVVTLATDRKINERNGGVFATRRLAQIYDFRDVDGRLPAGSPEPRS